MDTYALMVAGSAGFILGVAVTLIVGLVAWIVRWLRGNDPPVDAVTDEQLRALIGRRG